MVVNLIGVGKVRQFLEKNFVWDVVKESIGSGDN